MRIDDSATLTIYGSDFAFDGQPFGYGELTSILGGSYSNEPSRHLSGTLANGNSIDNDFYIGSDVSIVLTHEPSMLLLLGLGSLMLARRHSQLANTPENVSLSLCEWFWAAALCALHRVSIGVVWVLPANTSWQ